MIKNGVLIPWIALSYSHGDKELLEITKNALNKTFEVYKKAVDEGYQKYLVGHVIKPVFREIQLTMSEHTERIASLKGKVIVITGGAGIIGKEFVRAVVEQEGIAVIADIDDKRGENGKYSHIKRAKFNKH